jgi:hypothetical protein
MSISEHFWYRNDVFQSDKFVSDIGITYVDIGCRISPTLRSMPMPTYANSAAAISDFHCYASFFHAHVSLFACGGREPCTTPPPALPLPLTAFSPPLDKLHHHVRTLRSRPVPNTNSGSGYFCILNWHNGNTVSGPSLKVTKARDFSTPFFYKGKKSVICPGTGRKGSIVTCVFSVAAK